MAQADWTECTSSLSGSSLRRGVTAGIAPPNGGGTFIYGFNSIAVVSGAAALFTNQINFAPMSAGGIVRGALQRGPSAGNQNFSPFLFIGLQGPSIADQAYILGLSDDYPAHVELRKGALSGGLPSAAPGTLGVLRRSTATIQPGTWVHLSLEMVWNVSNDVVLKVKQNNLADHDVSTPVWEAVAGMADFIDDALGVNSGSLPFLNGRAGFGFACSDVNRRGYFDHLQIARQLSMPA